MKISERVQRKGVIGVSCFPFTSLPQTVTNFEEQYPAHWKMTDDNVLTSKDAKVLHGDLCIKGTRLPVAPFLSLSQKHQFDVKHKSPPKF